MLDEILRDFDPTPTLRPPAFAKLLNQLPEELKPLVKQSRDGLLTAMGVGYINIVKFDELLSKAYPDYNYDERTYKGEPCSMSVFINRKFGYNVNLIIYKLGMMV